MSSSPLSIIVDDQRTDYIVLTGPQPWTSTDEPEWFNGTSQSPVYALQNSGLFGTLQMKFHGTSVAFFGVTPPVFPDSQILSVSIDGSTPYNTSYSDPNPQTYRQWYQSPLLPDGPHVVSLSHIAGTSIDYAVVTVGTSTSLTNEHIIVDNDDPSVTFNGTWRRSQSMFNSGPQPDGFPYHNTTHQSTTAGDSFTYRFSGRSAAIYGIFNWAYLGLLSLNFTLDGDSLSQTYRVTADTPQFQNELGQQQNFLFYSYDFLQAEDHTLIVSVIEAINQTFSFDYITYKPSFSSLNDMPDLSQTSMNGIIDGDKSSRRHTFAIVAIIAGAVLLVVLLGILFKHLRRRRSVEGKYEPVYPFVPIQAQRPEVTVTRGLLSQSVPSTTASIYSDSTGNISTPQHDLSDLYETQGIRETFGSEPPTTGHPSIPAATTSSDTPRTLTTDVPQISRRSAMSTRSSGWDSMYTQSSPPSYDETTRGQPPPQLLRNSRV